MSKRKKSLVRYIADNILTLIGIILVWRGVWYILDGLDLLIWGGTHLWSAIAGIVVGFLFLYIPDGDLSSIERL